MKIIYRLLSILVFIVTAPFLAALFILSYLWPLFYWVLSGDLDEAMDSWGNVIERIMDHHPATWLAEKGEL